MRSWMFPLLSLIWSLRAASKRREAHNNHKARFFLSSNTNKIFHRYGRLDSDWISAHGKWKETRGGGFQMKARRSAREWEDRGSGEIDSRWVRGDLVSQSQNKGNQQVIAEEAFRPYLRGLAAGSRLRDKPRCGHTFIAAQWPWDDLVVSQNSDAETGRDAKLGTEGCCCSVTEVLFAFPNIKRSFHALTVDLLAQQ